MCDNYMDSYSVLCFIWCYCVLKGLLVIGFKEQLPHLAAQRAPHGMSGRAAEEQCFLPSH